MTSREADQVAGGLARTARAILTASRALLVFAVMGGGSSVAVAQGQPVTAPQPTVPERFTLEGEFVRIAYNNEGFVSLGYRLANESVGQQWMLLQAGITLRSPAKDFDLKREAISLKTPDGTVVPLPTAKEYRAVNLNALNMRAKTATDSINYFPAEVTRANAMRFFSDVGGAVAFDQVGLSSNRAAVGRLYFPVAGGIKTGQHWLIVKFATSEVQVPFRILTKEEAKEFGKKWEELKKEHDKAMKE